MTLYKMSHFYFKIYDGENFFDFDNLKKINGQLNNENGKDWEINFVFYELDPGCFK